MGMINGACKWLVDTFPDRTRVIFRKNEPYLLRFYFSPVIESSAEAESTPETCGLYLHHFFQGDLDADLHNHPWKWAWSLILTGRYHEEREDGTHTRKAGSLGLIKHSTYHRVTLPDDSNEKPVWTLFFVGPRVTSWGFKDKATGEHIPWKKYLTDRGEVIG